MGRIRTIARRTFLIGSAAIAGGVAFGYWKYRQPYANPLLDDLGDGAAALTEYVRIDGDGVTVIVPRAEMGQGVMTTLAALVAEELDMALEDVTVIHGPASHAYYNAAALEEGAPFASTDTGTMAETVRGIMHVPAKFGGMQLTGGSSSTPDAYEKMRRAGAAACEALKAAAAAKLGVDAGILKTEGGAVVAPGGPRLAYTSLATDAAKVELPDDPPLKPRADWRILGKDQARVDMIPKCTGTAEFSIDVRLPEMVYATVKMNPYLEGGIKGFDASEAKSMRGVIDVIELPASPGLGGGVAVIADNTWRAFRAAEAVTCDWDAGSYPADTAGLFKAIEESIHEGHQNSQFRDDGDVEDALSGGEIVEAEYRVPFLAHATMEPMNAVAWLRDGKLDIWAGNQIPTQARAEGAALTGLEPEAVTVHTTVMGGSFGRRAEMDFVKLAVMAAKAVEGRPVKLTWTREEDMTHDAYRPGAIMRAKGKAGGGKIEAMDLSIAAPSVPESQFGRIGFPMMGPDPSIIQGAWDQPFAIPHYRVTGYKTPMLCPISSWRSVGASFNGFFHDCFLDELAHAAGLDPLEARLQLCDHAPSRAVLEAVGEMSSWGSPLPEGRGRGVAYNLSFGVPTAEVIEVSVTDDTVKIEKAFAAADVGTALDPRNLEAQVMGGLVFGLAAAVMGEITFEDGAVQQTNFHDYDALRLYQCPSIDVRILETAEKIRGIGEPGTPPAAPALANAIFAATGKRIRELPFNKHIGFA